MRLRRRQFLILASATAMPLGLPARAAGGQDLVWRGTALGADAEIRLTGIAPEVATSLLKRVAAETERLEGIFSLYRPESELSRLNRDGVLLRPSQDFRLLLEASLDYWRRTGGAFNPALQPVWRFLAEHFAVTQDPPEGKAIQRLLRLCDPGLIDLSPDRIVLTHGMALSFNGIAQGYVTDRAAQLLRAEGLSDILINLGEIRALPGKSWRVAVSGGPQMLDLSGRALAQSAGRGTIFSADGRWHHLIDARTGTSANHVRAVTVIAETATAADALSTAFFTAPPLARPGLAAAFPGVEVIWERASDEQRS